MSNVIVPGTILAEPGSMTRAILDVFESLLAADIFAASQVGLARMSNAIAVGVCANIVASLDDTKYLQVDGGEIVGGDGGGGGAAPDTAEYLVGALTGSLSAERVVTNTATGVWDLSTPGQVKLDVPDASTSAKGVVELATSAETTAGLAVQASDTRLSDDRDPTSHGSSHASDGTDPIPAATESVRGTVELATSAETTAGLAVQASDTRMSDARTPLVHAISHQKTGSDELDLSGLPGLLADAQTPLAHASSHQVGGTDELTPKTVYELDWSAESTQLGLGDGNVLVDGVNWTAANTAAASTFQILNGSGLQIVASSGLNRTWTNTAFTSPSLRVAFEDLAADAAKYQLTLTVWSYFSAWSLPNSQNSIIAGCYAPAGAVYTAVTHATGFNNNGVSSYPMIQRGLTFTAATPLSSAYDVVVWRFLPGGSVDAWCGVWAAGWPTALTPIGSDNQPSASTIVVTAQIRRAGSTLIYSPATRSASGAPSFTLERTRIQIG